MKVADAGLIALVAAGADIQFVGELRYSLEDVYLQLMKDSADG
mgnify:CR=1 FL=1